MAKGKQKDISAGYLPLPTLNVNWAEHVYVKDLSSLGPTSLM
jgi:hypothetical protein